MTPTSIVAYLLLFAFTAFAFVCAALWMGRFLRPKEPSVAKGEIYECGESTIGSGYLQFDLRFYVVALLFIVFDVEVAFFFPWAVVFGKAARLLNPNEPRVVAVATQEEANGAQSPASAAKAPQRTTLQLSPTTQRTLVELGAHRPQLPFPLAGAEANAKAIESSARTLAKTAMADIAVFFGVLLVGFAYLWRKGDLNWIRATDDSGPNALTIPNAVNASPGDTSDAAPSV
jgi:NADH-quinone oxidoreductase subunit A